jgi:hypothetical protein
LSVDSYQKKKKAEKKRKFPCCQFSRKRAQKGNICFDFGVNSREKAWGWDKGGGHDLSPQGEGLRKTFLTLLGFIQCHHRLEAIRLMKSLKPAGTGLKRLERFFMDCSNYE